MTPLLLSRDPLATEGEATPGPDDVNPYDEREYELARKQPSRTLKEDPAEGDDPYVFDDVDDVLSDVSLPALDQDTSAPSFSFEF